jgi:hypothetical protein
MLRIGVVAALVSGSLAATATPALADNPAVQITEISPTTLGPGQSTTLRYQITNRPGPDDDVDISVNANGLTCNGDCGTDGLSIAFNSPRPFIATLRAPSDLPPGSTQRVTITVRAVAGGQDDSKSVQVTLRGPDKPDTIKSISGRVVNVATGRGIADATVALNDSDDHRYTTTTDRDGDFKFTSSDNKPISPGEILLGAGKEGFQNNQTSTNVGPGQAKTGVRITLKSNAAPSPSPSEASPTPEEEVSDLPSDEASAEESVDPEAAGNNSGSGGGGAFSWVLIILGGLLVALGVGAIVLLVIRRKEDGEDGTGDALPDPNGPRPTPGAQGVYRGGPEPTMVTGGAAMGGGPTMAMRPGLAEAPTMMHQPVDEFGDPYGTPMRAPQPGATQPGYGYQGANPGGYGPAGSPTAPGAPGSPGAPTAYGSASPTGYGGPAAGRASASASVSPPGPYAPRDYDAPGTQPFGSASATGPGGGYGYDEPTGRYDRNAGYGQADQRPSSGGYDRDHGRYDSPANAYDSRYDPGPTSGYGSGNGYSSGNGYGSADTGYGSSSGNGYDAPAGGYDGGRYQAPPQSGYEPGGYDGYGQQPGGYPPYEQGGQDGGYDQPGGYDRPPRQRSGSYDQRGYDQGYYDEPTTRGERPARRSLDWLDD